jgi:hypothetical protein
MTRTLCSTDLYVSQWLNKPWQQVKMNYIMKAVCYTLLKQLMEKSYVFHNVCHMTTPGMIICIIWYQLSQTFHITVKLFYCNTSQPINSTKFICTKLIWNKEQYVSLLTSVNIQQFLTRVIVSKAGQGPWQEELLLVEKRCIFFHKVVLTMK